MDVWVVEQGKYSDRGQAGVALVGLVFGLALVSVVVAWLAWTGEYAGASDHTVPEQLRALYRYLLTSVGAALLIVVGGWRYGDTGDRRWLAVAGVGFCLLASHIALLLRGY